MQSVVKWLLVSFYRSQFLVFLKKMTLDWAEHQVGMNFKGIELILMFNATRMG